MKTLLRASVNLLPARVRHWIKYMPIVARFQRFLVDQFLSGEPFVHTINAGRAKGLRFEATLPRDKAFWAGTFECDFTESLFQSVRAQDICYDVGAHRGYMSGVLALAGANRVVAFEPLPDNVVALQRLAQLNPQLTIQIEQVAVGKSDGEARFKVMADESMGKLAASQFQSSVAAARELNVKLRRIDSMVFADKLPPPNVIKIDVEGAEFDVLCGAARTISKFRPRLFIEAHSTLLADSCVQYLLPLGYQVRQLESGVLQPEHTRHLVAEPK